MFYAIGDIHGQKAQLERAFALIDADGGADAPLYFVGDLVDRGWDSAWVIQTIMDGQAAGKPWHCILGNHDLMLHQFVTAGNVVHPEILSRKSWLHHRLGGCRTLASYMGGIDIDHPEWISWDHANEHGLDPASPELIAAFSDAAKMAVPADHLNWIANLPLYLDAPDGHRFVHAGIRPNVAMADQTRSDLIWIRDGWLDYTADLDAMYVHGHTALDFPQHHGNRINLDGGAGYGRPLVPAVYDGTGWFTLDEAGRAPLRP
ncbi:metallophosphoesterase [Octadecabacter sp. G9-8]|uniref:Metallophosphoesterase n=1 Tax=Octadecabacter dasysiphoniae TaxID=2909341 RepID=A0ABS9CXU1_9RHOB|nr:metallophosphoesterase [Octadecabacter dasysiphoniae]MCF2871657.1 metallophosphoesterase [Octadecabacter dasysiphoniae]